MHIWNIDALTDELRTGKLTEAQSFRYFLVILLVQAIPLYLPIRSEGPLTFYSMGFGAVIPFLWLASGVAGILICFKANQQSDGVDFIRRIVCLGVPSSVRTLVFCPPLVILITLLVSPFVAKGEGHTAALIIMGISMEFMIIVQCVMIYRRLRGPMHSEPDPEHAA